MLFSESCIPIGSMIGCPFSKRRVLDVLQDVIEGVSFGNRIGTGCRASTRFVRSRRRLCRRHEVPLAAGATGCEGARNGSVGFIIFRTASTPKVRIMTAPRGGSQPDLPAAAPT